MLTGVLALQDAGLGWDGEMRHLPSVGVPTAGTATGPCLIVKQDNNGATFVISDNPLSWAGAGARASRTFAESSREPIAASTYRPEARARPAAGNRARVV
jgi:hypothetical protein